MKLTKRDLEVSEYASAMLKARDSFLDFALFMNPDWMKPPDFHVELAGILDKLEKNTLGYDHILITMPPRHSKSTYSTDLFPCYFMGRDPRRFVMSASYSASLAENFGANIKNRIISKRFQQVFPEMRLSQDTQAKSDWATTAGGRYLALGMEGAASGRPANLLIVDDPIKNRQEAESLVYREKTWESLKTSLMTRLQPQMVTLPNGEPLVIPPKMIVILTRWHPDDIAGRLQELPEWKEGKWLHINYPAITEDEHGNRKALWIPSFNLDVLDGIKNKLGERDFEALYQQNPFVLGGNLIKKAWWQEYTEQERDEMKFASIIISVDTAFKTKEESDYSVAMVGGMTDKGDIVILDVMRGKYEFPDLKRRLITLNSMWRGKGLRAMYIEDKASGTSLIQELKRESGISIIPYKVNIDKVSRVNAVLPMIEGGRVFIPKDAHWKQDFITETVAFPGSTNDDQVDAMSMLVDVLSRTGMSLDDVPMDLSLAKQVTIAGGVKDFGKSLNAQIEDSTSWKGWGNQFEDKAS